MKKLATLIICAFFLSAPLVGAFAYWGVVIYPPLPPIPLPPVGIEVKKDDKKWEEAPTYVPKSLFVPVRSNIDNGVWIVNFLEPIGEVSIKIVNQHTQEVMVETEGNTELSETFSVWIIDWESGDYLLTVEDETYIYSAEYSIE